MPLVPNRSVQGVAAIDFLYGEGAAAADPAADTLVAFGAYGPLLYNPSGATGAAGDNGEWGLWHSLCSGSVCASGEDGLVTAAGSVVVGSAAGATQLSRGADRGRTWTYNFDDLSAFPFFESTLPALAGPTGVRAMYVAGSYDGITVRSQGDGAPGTWTVLGGGYGTVQSFGEVPPSAALPDGRLLLGVWNGALYSDDGGATYTPSNRFGQAAYIVYSFAFLPDASHPYGGVAYAGMENLALYPGPSAEVYRSDDGGATWTLAHTFTPEETGQPETQGSNIATAVLLATPDGALWSGVSLTNGSFPNRGSIMRSPDGGTTWARADGGYGAPRDRGWRVNQLRLGRDDRLYAATEYGVWRTTGPAVAGEASPSAMPGEIGVSVRPNPAGGRVEVVVSLAAAGAVRVVVLDALGREVAVVLDGAAAAGGQVVSLDTGSWPAGVYVVRATVGAQVSSVRLVVAR